MFCVTNVIYCAVAILLWGKSEGRTSVINDGQGAMAIDDGGKTNRISLGQGPQTGWNGGGISMVNGGGQGSTIISGGGQGTTVIGGGSVSTNCNGGACQTCINGRCFGSCPVAVCEYGCMGLVFFENDQCPKCRCQGFTTVEPCDSQNDCTLSGGRCTNQICRYPPINKPYTTPCVFSYECTSDTMCSDNRCIANPGGPKHAVNVSCVFVHQCPNGFGVCKDMTCWEGGARVNDGQQGHVPGASCVFEYQCPTQYSCKGMSCVYTGQEHGTYSCVFDSQCPGGRCRGMTCKPH